MQQMSRAYLHQQVSDLSPIENVDLVRLNPLRNPDQWATICRMHFPVSASKNIETVATEKAARTAEK